jgi:predicted RNA binding protein YcfA (HicA-like mRNA interferase family)
LASVKKIVGKFLREPSEPEFDFEEVKKVLEKFDYKLSGGSGSHFCFRRKRSPLINIPTHKGKVKKKYVKEMVKILNLGEWYEKNKK